MVKNADRIDDRTTADHNPHITHVGRILRKTTLDKTANLIKILQRAIRFVGPQSEL